MQYLGTPDTGKIANWARMNPLLGPGIWTKDVIAGLWGDHLKSEGKKLATEGRKEHERALGQYVPGSAKHLTREIVSTTAEMLPAITLGIVTRNPTLSLTMMGTQAGSAKYDQSIREGRSHEAATIDGVFFGMAEAFTEKIPLGILVKRGGGYFINIVKAAGAEAIQEPINQLLQELYDKGVLGKDMTLDETIDNLIHAAKVGGGAGALLSAITGLFIRRRKTGNRPDTETEVPPETRPTGEVSDRFADDPAMEEAARRVQAERIRQTNLAEAQKIADQRNKDPEGGRVIDSETSLPREWTAEDVLEQQQREAAEVGPPGPTTEVTGPPAPVVPTDPIAERAAAGIDAARAEAEAVETAARGEPTAKDVPITEPGVEVPGVAVPSSFVAVK